jgi:putative ABC transport system permease protein
MNLAALNPLRLPRTLWRSASRTAQNVITALVQIWANKGRSILTTLGIIIAVASTIVVVSFVQGFGNYITKMVQGYGTQFMVVYPMFPPNAWRLGLPPARMDLADVEAVRTQCPHVRRVTPFLFRDSVEVTFGLERMTEVPTRGTSEIYQAIRNYYVDVGRFFGPVEVENHANVVVLGRTILKHLQADEQIIGQHVQVNGHRFKVVGILEAKGSMFGEDQDKTIIIPYTSMINMFPQDRRSVRFLLEASSEADLDAAQQETTRVLRDRHHLQPGQPDDFGMNRQDQFVREFKRVRDIASGSLAGIVSISLLVGGIGIMNVMLVSVTERTREIGLRKSIGARRRDVMMQFLTEAVVLCTLGGLAGVILGYSISFLAGLHPQMVQISVPWWSVALALGFSAAAGVVFGIIPACKAAILHPIDALRHE